MHDTNWLVCPVRNGIDFTRAALPTFFAQNPLVKVLLLDNDSNDGTTHWARAQDIIYWHRRPALSVAASWNLCLKWIFGEQKAQYALVVNNDVLLRPDTYRLLLADGGEFVTATGVGSMEQFREPGEPDNKRPHPDFSCFLIRKSCWDKVGLFNEEYVGAYCEDSEYHVRMHRVGIDAHSIGLPFYHPGSGTIRSADPKEAQQIIAAAEANRKRFQSAYGALPGTPGYEDLFR